MSASEAERFADDLKAKPDMRAALKTSVGGLGLSGVVAFAKSKGYAIDVADAKGYVERKAKMELSDEQLDRIAGGKSVGAGGSTGQPYTLEMLFRLYP